MVENAVKAEEAAVRELPMKEKDWTEDDLSECLRRIDEHKRQIARHELAFRDRLARLTAAKDLQIKQEKSAIKALVARLKKAAGRLRDGWKQKSVVLAWGMVGFRQPAASLTLADGATKESAIAWLEANGHGDCVKREPVLLVEVLETKSAAVIDGAGYRWTNPGEAFGYETKTEMALKERGK